MSTVAPLFARKIVRDLWFCISTPHLLAESSRNASCSAPPRARARRSGGTTATASGAAAGDGATSAAAAAENGRVDPTDSRAASLVDGAFPLLVDDRWTQRVATHPATLAWLRELDADASHLTMWLTANYARSFRRLGFYFA
jgi:hypothetical protein